jgi:hypothetical protein
MNITRYSLLKPPPLLFGWLNLDSDLGTILELGHAREGFSVRVNEVFKVLLLFIHLAFLLWWLDRLDFLL